MLVYFLILVLLNYRDVEAAPILINAADISPPVLKRSLFGIIWSCLSTTIICAWTSVHPNVPPPNKWKARWNRLRIMFWMITAPELVLAWAVRQFFAAREIRDVYNARHPGYPESRKWVLKHGHLLIMGGLSLVDPDQKYANRDDRKGTVLTVKYFKENPGIDLDIPEITPEDIDDRSKGDALWKVIAILQTTWFIIQCIARGQQRLALTELELVTLALASLNAMAFLIWWHKPLGAQEPLRIYLKTEPVKVEDEVRQGNGREASFGLVTSKGWALIEQYAGHITEFFSDPCDDGCSYFVQTAFVFIPICLIYTITFPVFVLFPLGIVLLLRIIKAEPAAEDTSPHRGLLAARIVASLQKFRYWLTSTVSNFVEGRLEEVFAGYYDGVAGLLMNVLFGWFFLLPLLFVFLSLFIILLIPFFALLFLVSIIFTAVFGIITSSSVRPGAPSVPSFYAPSTPSDRWSRMVVFSLFGVVFGGLHLIGWNFNFPTHSEQSLWRFTSFAITVIPLVVAPIDFLLASRDIKSCGKLEQVVLLSLDLLMTILLFIYVPTRLSLIAQALALLRSPPPSALTALDWTKYIPHLFSSS